jgi:hypothetical protein
MSEYEFHPSETGSRETSQPWGSHQVKPYTPEQEYMWSQNLSKDPEQGEADQEKEPEGEQYGTE